jgi:hypothetical protein
MDSGLAIVERGGLTRPFRLPGWSRPDLWGQVIDPVPIQSYNKCMPKRAVPAPDRLFSNFCPGDQNGWFRVSSDRFGP